jgi:hypothetical protein
VSVRGDYSRNLRRAPSLIPPSAKEFRLRIYDAKEEFVRDVNVSNCACLTTRRLTDIDVIYANANYPAPYYTEMEGSDEVVGPGSFTGYIATRTSSLFAATRDDFRRLPNGNVHPGLRGRGN